jgi:hypothetical protein
MRNFTHISCCVGVIALGFLAGCEGRPTLMPNSDSTLNKTSTQFAADAAKRFPYPAEAAKAGEAPGRAEIDVMLARLQILNSGDEDWNDVEIWVNQAYVCHVASIAKGKEKVKTVDFTMLYDDKGNYFTTNGGQNPVKLVEMKRNGQMYQIHTSMAD